LRLRRRRRSLTEFGIVENLVVRPHPERPGVFEVISGNHRLRLLCELGFTAAPVALVELVDARARLLAQTLNRTLSLKRHSASSDGAWLPITWGR
jgi:ParB-like chromosome segregation protein Spo0J